MPPNEARLFFVVTVKGDLGPFSKQELREQLREQVFAGTDRVRNAWGRPLGSVSEVLGNASQMHQAPPQPTATTSSQRRPATSGPPWPIIAVAGGMLALGLILWLMSGGSPPPPPPPPVSTPEPPQREVRPTVTPPATRPAVQQTPSPPPASAPLPTASSRSLPAGFTYLDLGDARPRGSVNANDRGIIVISGGGEDIWGSRDECAFMHRTLPGDATLTVEVRQMEDTDPWDKAGLMIRASTASDAPQCSIVAVHSGLIQFITRQGQGHESTGSDIRLPAFPIWLRLERRGTSMCGSASTDGRAWQSVGTIDLANLGGTAVAGLAVCSHNRSVTNRTVFAGLTVNDGR